MSAVEALTALADSSQALICLYDGAGQCRHAVGQSWELLGYTPEEVRDGDLRALLHPHEDAEVLARLRGRAVAGETGEVDDYRVLARDGEVVHLRTRFFQLADPDHPEYRAAGLTTRCHTPSDAEAEKEALSWREYLYAMDQHALVSIADARGEILYVNEKFCTAVGRTRAELVGANHRIMSTGIHDRAFYQDLWGTIAGGRVWQGEITLRTAGGGTLWTWMTVVPVGGESGRPMRYISLRTDITGTRASEERLRLFKTAIDSSPVGVTIADVRQPDAPLVYVNQALESMTGYRADEMLGHNCRFLQGDESEQVGVDAIRTAIREERATQVLLHNFRKDGTPFWNEFHLAPVLGEDGRASYFIGIQNDVTEQHRVQEELEAAREEAEKASELKSRFLANVSHELRTPLNAIIGMAGLLGETELNEEQRYYIEVFENAGRNLLDLVNNLLDMSKLDAGRLPVNRHTFDLHALLHEQFALFRQRGQEKGVAMELDIQPDVPQWVVSDSVLVRQIVNNLLSNAVKFTDSGTIRTTAEMEVGDTDAPVIHLAVADSGPGISEADQQRIFNAFVQADASETRRHGGTGLGLAVTREFAQLIGGSVWMESREGVGSTFHVTLPVEEGAAPTAEPVGPGGGAAGKPADGEGAATTLDFTGRRVLVAEDEPTNVLLLRSLLEQWGLEVVAVDNGAKAEAAWREDRFDLLLMDLQMPVMDGEEAARRLFEAADNGEVAAPAIVALSAHALEENRRRCLEAGFAAYLTKPVDRRALYQVLERVLGARHDAE